jgi:hypothetical protein
MKPLVPAQQARELPIRSTIRVSPTTASLDQSRITFRRHCRRESHRRFEAAAQPVRWFNDLALPGPPGGRQSPYGSLGGLIAAAVLLLAAPSSAQPQHVAYPEVKVVLESAYKPNAAFDKMNGTFLDAVQRKDVAALMALVAPTFLWTVNDHPADELDLGRDAVHNFKVAFGFRALGDDDDGGVDSGPYWEVLTSFAEEPGFYTANDADTLVCGPMAAEVLDDKAFDQARRKLDAIDEPVEWYFTVAAETPIAKTPGDTGIPIAKVGTIAMPLVSFYPSEKEGGPLSPPTHFEVLLPSGQTGWVPVNAVRPLETDHLCYARTAAGVWKIASINQVQRAP